MKLALILLALCSTVLIFPISIFAAGTNVDLANSSSYSLMFKGASATGGVTTNNAYPVDIDHDGKQDLIIGSISGLASNASIFIIYGTLLQTFTPGSTIDLSNSSNYNVRFTGRTFLGFGQPAAGDIDGDGKLDLAFNSPLYPNSGGSVWVVNNRLFGNLTGTGNQVDISNTSNYNFRFSSPYTSDNGNFGYNLKLVDVTGNGKADLLIGDPYSSVFATHDGEMFVIYDSIMNGYDPSSTGNEMPLSDTNNFNVVVQGLGGDSPNFTNGDFNLADINGDGRKDLAIGAWNDDYSYGDAGAVYILYNNLFGNETTTGNVLEMTDSSDFSIRFDGANAYDYLGGWMVEPSDVTGDGKVDLILGANGSDNNSRSLSGSVYVINNDLFSRLSGSGNVVRLEDNTKWTTRIDGAVAGDRFGNAGTSGDFTNDGQKDLLIGAGAAGNNGRSLSGSLYLFSQNLFNLSGTGNTLDISNQANYTKRYDGAETNNRLTGFPDNPTHEATGLDINSDGVTDAITISRLYGGAGALYVIFGIPNAGSSGGTSNPNVISGWAKPISVGPHYFGSEYSFITAVNRGVIGVNGGAFSPITGILAGNDIDHDDLYITFDFPVIDLLTSNYQIPVPWSKGINTVSEIYSIQAVAAFNGYPVTITDNAFIVRIPYYANKMQTGKTPTIIWFNPQTQKWQKLTTPMVLDPITTSVMTTTNNFGFFSVTY